jgi:hypothetical protein
VWDCIGYFGRNEVLVPLVDEVIITDNRGILPPDVYHFIGVGIRILKLHYYLLLIGSLQRIL